MAVVALVESGEGSIRALPGMVADVERIVGSDYTGCGCYGDGRSSSMKIPTEIIQQIYTLLCPRDFNAARHTCRSWFVASLNHVLLVEMLRQGGWWSSILRILSPMTMARSPGLNQERIMSKWISRECNLYDMHGSAFREVGYADFKDMVSRARAGGLKGAVTYAVSLCGRYLVATHGQIAYVFELNHVCPPGRSAWSVPLRRRQGLPLGFLRPVTSIICPRRIISCSMDTSAGRYSAAFLMEGRVGMVCDVAGEAQRLSKLSSAPASDESSVHTSASGSGSSSPNSTSKALKPCVCHGRSSHGAPRVEKGQRCVYRNVCHADDPPRSVAICPQRNCVAFGCAAGIELHWVDALTGQDLSRWFPLASPSDFLYFLPARRGIDTARKLRLISSAAGLGNPLESLSDIVQGFSAMLLGSSGTAVVSLVNTAQGQPSMQDMHSALSTPRPAPWPRPIDVFGGAASNAGSFRKVSAGSADHFRAVPLSDGYHILFTDPRTGNLCLGTDAPVGSLTRLLRKVWFRPPVGAASPVPILYAAGADTRHGVRVVATFSARGPVGAPEPEADEQLVVFYTVPPDLFHDMSRATAIFAPPADQLDETGRRRVSASWHLDENYRAIDIFSEPFQNSSVYPIEINGQPVATCNNLTEIALDSCPEMIIWAFSAEGWARTWAVDSGRFEPYTRTAVQRDGSVRRVDSDGDIAMADGEEDGDVPETSSVLYQPLDGAAGNSPREAETRRGCYSDRKRWRDGDRMSGTVSVDLVQELNGIVRLDVELR
ncbi:F-box domain-containing protein [Tolypocladium capitatum]|uniref:F-box domain-containing protein n=1 Tax=Tolypocladium capitatum TaxID=45235 RepID=A0A2K3Q6W5_9HYPO|nr:F-box domain-containing protein [Tolypocladium capitatum]